MEQPAVPGPVVVGVDGSDESVAALRWAKRHATRIGSRVRAVTAFEAPPILGGSAIGYVDHFMSAEASAALHAERAIASADFDRPIEHRVIAGKADEVIPRHAEDASVIVLGTRETRKWYSLLRGSLTNRLSGNAPCPVVSVGLDHVTTDLVTTDLATREVASV